MSEAIRRRDYLLIKANKSRKGKETGLKGTARKLTFLYPQFDKLPAQSFDQDESMARESKAKRRDEGASGNWYRCLDGLDLTAMSPIPTLADRFDAEANEPVRAVHSWCE